MANRRRKTEGGDQDDVQDAAWVPSEPGGDAILGAALEGLRRAADEVEVERSTAETLQRSLLPERLPEVAGLRMAARYVPGSSEARIGGDWYDALALRDGRLALVMGDVVGRGIQAAAQMAHLQSAVRAYALEGLRPAVILERMNGFAHELDGRTSATLMLAFIDPDDETVRIASAGHPPPVLVDGAGVATYGIGPSGNPLGASQFPKYEESTLAFPVGNALILYTDGIVERPGEALEISLERFREIATGLPDAPEDACEALLTNAGPDDHVVDDIALLVVRLDAPTEALEVSFPAEPASLTGVRRALGRWLNAAGVAGNDAYELQVACGEACANAIAHAYPIADAQFVVRAARHGSDLAIEVVDFGAWRAPRGGAGGRGIALIEQLTDSLQIERGDGGTTVRMTRRMSGVAA